MYYISGYYSGGTTLSTGEIVGIVVTLILLILVIAALILLLIQRGLPDKIKGRILNNFREKGCLYIKNLKYQNLTLFIDHTIANCPHKFKWLLRTEKWF